MKIKFLLIGTSLSFIPLTVNAQCVATQDCATLGYTETSCNGGKGIKCPFGNKWACLGANEEEIRDKVCQELGFTSDCNGPEYSGGIGQNCKGKYTQCNCAPGYEWKNGTCLKSTLTGAFGNLYYCNGTVVGVKTSDMVFYVSLKDLGKKNCDKARTLCEKYDFCNNRTGNLPTREEFQIIVNNKSSLNNLFLINGGEELKEDAYVTSTSSKSNCYYFDIWFNSGNFSHADEAAYFRPILKSY